MTENNKRNHFESFIKISIDGSKAFVEDLPSKFRPVARFPIFIFLIIFSLIAAPIVFIYKYFSKKTIDPFFKLRTELETKWYRGKQEEALSELRVVKENIVKNEDKIIFKGVQISPYGKFKYSEFYKVLWLLYHWEFHSGNFQEATEVCDYIIGKLEPTKTKESPLSDYWEEWILNKAKAIYKKDGATATQEYLLKFVDPKNEECSINKYLFEIREESKKVV